VSGVSIFLPLTLLRGEENRTLDIGLYNWTGKRLESGIDLTSLVLTGALLSIVAMAIMMTAMCRYRRTGVTLGPSSDPVGSRRGTPPAGRAPARSACLRVRGPARGATLRRGMISSGCG
jgi:hypothetical protein